LQSIKFLQTAVGLRGYAAKDPLTEFKLEGCEDDKIDNGFVALRCSFPLFLG
jgi:preprotein translocase subunit SecA